MLVKRSVKMCFKSSPDKGILACFLFISIYSSVLNDLIQDSMPKQNFRHSHRYLSDHAYFSNTDILSPPLGSSAAALTWVYVPAVVQTASEAAPDTWLEHKYYKL